MRQYYFIGVLLIISQFLWGQVKTEHGYVVEAKVVDGDTMPHIKLRQVIIFPKRKFKNAKEMLRYRRMVRNVRKVLPYAKYAAIKLKEINDHMETIEDEKKRKSYMDEEEKRLKMEFEEELKRLTVTQGKILIKLIDRETGNTTYTLVKDLKGSFSAFLYQSIARLFGTNLKREYDPTGDDKMLEEIVILIENGQL